jgi:hypothetical protein
MIGDTLSGKLSDHEKQNAETRRWHLSRFEDFLTEGAKAMLLLNSGGIVAMLGFLQALAGKQEASLVTLFKPWGIAALLGYALAALLSGISYFPRAWAFLQFARRRQAGRWVLLSAAAVAAAGAMFLLTTIVVTIGVARAL